jgi:hypothetical protein
MKLSLSQLKTDSKATRLYTTQSQRLHRETSKRSIKSLAKIGQLFKELKFNQEPREAIFCSEKLIFFPQIFPIKSTYTRKLSNPGFPNGSHINLI